MFTEQLINHSSFTKELYKLIRNKNKKLEDIAKIEDITHKGGKINNE